MLLFHDCLNRIVEKNDVGSRAESLEDAWEALHASEEEAAEDEQ